MLTTLRDYLRDGPTDAEVERAKDNYRLRYYTIGSNKDILSNMCAIAKGSMSWDDYDKSLSQLDQITPEQIKITMQKHIHLDRLTFVILGPKDIRDVIKSYVGSRNPQ
jgi:predicted Zn-dependent peptidase